MAFSSNKLKSVDFYRKIPRDLTEASLSGAGLSIIAALFMMFLFGMELSSYMSASTSTSIVVDRSSPGEYLRVDLNMSFPALSCEFATVDVSDVLGTSRLNITNKIHKFPIDPHLQSTGDLFHPDPVPKHIKHGDDFEEATDDNAAIPLNSTNFDEYAQWFPILVVNFHTPWCYWSNRLKPSWEKAAKIIRERHDLEFDGRILVAKVDCMASPELCKKHHIQGYPTIRIFRKGSDASDEHGHHGHESYYGDRDTDSLVSVMEDLVTQVSMPSRKQAIEENKNLPTVKKPAPRAGGCRIEGFLRVKKVPGEIVIAARSNSHSFDASEMNMSHVIYHFSFGKHIDDLAYTKSRALYKDFGNFYDRLSGRSFINTHEADRNVTIEHYIQIVKSEIVDMYGRSLTQEYEYTAHSSLIESVDIPVAKFRFDLSPMQVLITEDRKYFWHFITNVCAIIGGVFTVAGILDSIFHNTVRAMKKTELGKNF